MKEENEVIVERLNSKLKDIDLKLSELRKAGLDTKIADLKKMNVKSKIKMAGITGEKNDIDKVEKIFESIEEEIVEISESQVKKKEKPTEESAATEEKKEEQENTHKDYSKTEAIQRVYKLIGEIEGFLEKKEYAKAVKEYSEVREIYNLISKEHKKAIYEEIQFIYKKIIKSGAVKV